VLTKDFDNLAFEMTSSSDEVFDVRLCGELSLPTIANAHEKILSAFEQDMPIAIDLEGVTGADLSLIQLIEAARKSAARRGRSLILSAPAAGETLRVLERGGFLGSDAARSAFWLQDTVTPQ
jgi:anti-anti-sigma regulatory factor